jgi:dolichol kinase
MEQPSLENIRLMNLILVSLAFLILFVLLEILKNKTHIQNEYTRKIAHVISGAIVYFLPYWLDRNEIVGLAFFFTLFLLVTRHLGFFSSIHKVERKTLGEVYFPLGVGLLALYSLPDNLVGFQFGILILALADTASGIIGSLLGKHKLLYNKSWEGALAFFIASFLIYIIFILIPGNGSIYSGLVISLILTIIESALARGFDNLLLPIAAAFLLNFINR